MKVLLVEDDLDLGYLIQEELKQKNFSVFMVRDLKQSHCLLETQEFALAIIDLNLPDGQGFDLLPLLQCPVMIMSALNNPQNRLKAAELGAVDFIPKPFLLKELFLKMEKILGDHSEIQRVWDLDGVVLDLNKRKIVTKDKIHLLNKRNFRTLDILSRRYPQVVSRDEIIDYVYGQDHSSSHRSVDNTVLWIRQMLGDDNHRWIRSVRGEGYQWMLEDALSGKEK